MRGCLYVGAYLPYILKKNSTTGDQHQRRHQEPVPVLPAHDVRGHRLLLVLLPFRFRLIG